MPPSRRLAWTRNAPRSRPTPRLVPGKIKRRTEYVNDVEMNCLLVNCRSLKPKLKSLIMNFEMNKNTVALLNETWFKKGDSHLKGILGNIKLEHEISFIRRDRGSRGGGVAIAYDMKKIELKKVHLKSLRGKDFEIVAAAGKIIGVKNDEPWRIHHFYAPLAFGLL